MVTRISVTTVLRIDWYSDTKTVIARLVLSTRMSVQRCTLEFTNPVRELEFSAVREQAFILMDSAYLYVELPNITLGLDYDWVETWRWV